MRDRYGVEVLPNEFFGVGKYKDCRYKLIKGYLKERFYSVYDDVCDNIYFEVAEIKLFISPINNRVFEHYPTDNLLDHGLWRFYDFDEANEFYTSKM